MLENYIRERGITNFVVPTDSGLMPELSKENPKIVSGISEAMMDVTATEPMEIDNERRIFDASDIFYERVRQSVCDLREERKPFTIKLALTGGFFEVDGESKHMLFDIVIITPAKNFDLYGYIVYIFLNAPKNPQIKEQWKNMCACWNHIIMYEANYNCNMNGDPLLYKTNPGGVMGFFTLTNMLSIPYRIYNIVHKQYPSATNLRVLGCPKLSYARGLFDDSYALYYHRSVNIQTGVYEQLNVDLKAMQITNDKERGNLKFKVQNVGGWILKSVDIGDGFSTKKKFLRFGHFPFPVMCSFACLKYVDGNRDAFRLNLGTFFPLTVTKKMRDFMTFDVCAGSCITIPDEHILKSTEAATPLNVFEKYYGPESNMDDLRDTKLAKWYVAFADHVRSARTSGSMSVEDAMVQIELHLFNCMKQHESIARADGYGSQFFKQ